jgi:Protein of unknown function (DUF3499)
MLANDTGVIYPLVMRSCAKTGCRKPAAATIGIRYAARELVVADLIPQQDPNLMELCEDHTERMTPPFGWTLVDTRRVPVVPGVVSFGVEATSA